MRILLVDDHDVVRKGLRRMVEHERDWEICGEANEGLAAVTLAAQQQPDVVVLDFSMPGLNGAEATRRIKDVCPKAEILVFTMHDTEEIILSAFQAGARGFVLKSSDEAELVLAIRTVSMGRPYFNSDTAEALLINVRNHPMKDKGLTDREREVVQLVAEGRTSKEIAKSLRISVKTAETHRASIMRKLNVHSTVDLVRYAIRNHIIEP